MVDLRLLTACLLALAPTAWGQDEPALTLALDRDSVGVGEPLVLNLISDEPLAGGQRWQWPTLRAGDSLPQGWEVLSVSELDSSASPVLDAGLRRQQQVIVMAWDTGIKVLEPLSLADSGTVAASTDAVLLEVGLAALEPNAAPKPMQGFKPYGFTWWERIRRVLPYIIGALLLALLAKWLYQRWRNREMHVAEDIPAPAPEVPAHITALAMLRALETDQPWNAGRGKEAQATLSEAVRLHLQGSLGVKALERTTDELAQTLLSAPVRGMDPSERQWVVQILQHSDLVKFAKQDMDGDAHLRVIRESIQWVERTIPHSEGDTSDTTENEGHDG